MARPIPTRVLHFTRIEHLPTILTRGLVSDDLAKREGLLSQEVGNSEVKDRRTGLEVGAPPGGRVSEYVPFYFAPRSPPLYAITNGGVPNYKGGSSRIVYLSTTLETLQAAGLTAVISDRNAALAYASYWPMRNGEPAPDFVDWALMEERLWTDTVDYPDRRERRMAECLVHQSVPRDLIQEVTARSEAVATEAREIAREVGLALPVRVRPEWYF